MLQMLEKRTFSQKLCGLQGVFKETSHQLEVMVMEHQNNHQGYGRDHRPGNNLNHII